MLCYIIIITIIIILIKEDAFNNVLKFGLSVQKIESVYKETVSYFNLYRGIGQHLSMEEVKKFKLNGKYMSVMQILFMQLATDSIYKQMRFMSVKDNTDFIKYNDLIMISIHEDGFQYNLQSRRNMLITMTNCSVSNIANSRNCCSIIGLIDTDEDRWSLSLIRQRIDLEILWLHVLGFVDLRTGRSVGIICTNIEDTGGLEKTMGKDCASGSWRWHLSKHGANKHHQQWKLYHLPISVDIKLAERIYREYENVILKPYLNSDHTTLTEEDLYLCEFNKSMSNSRIKEMKQEFEKVRKKFNEFKQRNHGFIGNFQGAKSIWTFGSDGLHLSLRISNHTLKGVILFTVEYSDFLRDNSEMITKNHGKHYDLLTLDELLQHFKDCCHIPFYFDKNNPNRLKIKSEGTSKRKYFDCLGRLIKCDVCKYDILKGSPLQPYLAQMILCMVYSLTPFELLEPENYQKYYEYHFGGEKDNIKIETKSAREPKEGYCNLNKSHYYMTNHNKIWNQMYFNLYASLFGCHKTTRYQHMLCYTSELYCHVAYVLKSTPRALYGTDAGEHMNDKVKVLVHRISNKFVNYMNPELPPKAIDMIMNYILYEYYHVREKNPKFDTLSTQQRLKEEQKKKDYKTIQRPIKIMDYFKQNNVKYKLNVEQFDDITREYYNKYSEYYKDDDEEEEEDEYKTEQNEEFKLNLENQLQQVQNYIDLQMRAEVLIHEDNQEDDENDDDDVDQVSSDDNEEGFINNNNNNNNNDNNNRYAYDDDDVVENDRSVQTQTKFKHVKCIEYFIKDYDELDATATLTDCYDLEEKSQEIKCLKSQHFFCLGKNDGFYMRFAFWTGSDWHDYKIMIPWINVAYISYCKTGSGCVKIAIKYCIEPRIRKIKYVETTKSKKSKVFGKKKQYTRKWDDIDSDKCPASVQNFIKHKKIVMKLIAYRYSLRKVKEAIVHHSRIIDTQILERYTDFKKKIPFKITDQERQYHEKLYRASHSPCLQSHEERCGELYYEILHMFDAANGRTCASLCGHATNKVKVGFFEQHPICIQEDDGIDTCDSDILKSIHNDRFKPNYSRSRRLSYVFYYVMCFIMLCVLLCYVFYYVM